MNRDCGTKAYNSRPLLAHIPGPALGKGLHFWSLWNCGPKCECHFGGPLSMARRSLCSKSVMKGTISFLTSFAHWEKKWDGRWRMRRRKRMWRRRRRRRREENKEEEPQGGGGREGREGS